MPFYSRFMCGVLRAFSVETLPCLDIFDLTICGMGLFVRPISREVGDNESNAFRVIGGIMRRSAKAAPRTFGCVVALALATGLGAAVPAMADEVAAPYEGDLQVSAQAESWQAWGGCEWMVDSEGCLTIRPKDGADAGRLPDNEWHDALPWHDYACSIESVKVEDGVWASGSSANGLFAGLSSAASIDLSGLDISRATSMSSMFWGCSSLASLDLSGWSTPNVTSMSDMFLNCPSLTVLDLSSFDTSNVVDFREMFKGCSSLEDLNISSFDTRNASMMDFMFDGCDGLSIVRLGKNFYFTNESGRMCSLPDGYWCQERTHKFYNAIDVPDGVDSIYTRGIWAVESHWEQDANGWWYRNPDDSYPANTWYSIDGSWYYFNGSGYMVTGWQNIGGTWYYLGGSGAMATGWQSIGAAWYWFDDSGAMATGWRSVGGTYYFFGESGAMQTGWCSVGGTWYWFDGSGAMATGWESIGGSYYYFNGSGAMQTGWLSSGGAWYWLNGSGAMAVGWQSVGGTYYSFNGSGVMQTGWLSDGGTWYYLSGSGAMQTGWQSIGGSYYYFKGSGAMASSEWVGDYYLSAGGTMATNQWVGSYYVGSDGRWIRGYQGGGQQGITQNVYYVPGSSVYHTHWCRTMGTARNYNTYSSVDEAIAHGAKRECKNCQQMD